MAPAGPAPMMAIRLTSDIVVWCRFPTAAEVSKWQLQATNETCPCSQTGNGVCSVSPPHPGHSPNARHDGTIGACSKPVAIGSCWSSQPSCCVSVHTRSRPAWEPISISQASFYWWSPSITQHSTSIASSSCTAGQVLPHGSQLEHHISSSVFNKSVILTSRKVLGYTRRLLELSIMK